jgi:sialate O-acetylesterase
MQWTVANANDAAKEIAAANYPRLRLFSVPRKIATTPQLTVEGRWRICSPQTIKNFSAVGYYFGRQLHQDLDVPIGLIHSSWGGTIAEAWTSAEALSTMDDFRQAVQDLQSTEPPSLDHRGPGQKVADWWNTIDSPRLKGAWREVAYDDGKWQSMPVPTHWEKTSEALKEFDGVVRFRREFELPASASSHDARLTLGPIDDVDTTWVNGHRVGATIRWDRPRSYKVPNKFLQPGKNVIAVRVFDNHGAGGIYGTPSALALQMDGGPAAIPLAGQWKYEVGKATSELPAFPKLSRNPNPNVVTVLYNAMIAPLKPYGIRGAIWYQGEANANRAQQYRQLLPTMIADWRDCFGQGNFPFFIVQLANFKKLQTQPVEPGWADIRESQQLIADEDPNVGLAVITDIGAANDIHPRNKQDVGQRLALSALAIAYGRDVEHSGPVYRDHVVEGNSIRIRFDHVGGGLVVRDDDGTLKGFAIAGEDGRFVWAEAIRDGHDVVVSSSEIGTPQHVRYNWANNPIGNLFNRDGLPAAPFRTDRESED